ncbi:GNAT family N-acetyltransferase [Ectothiorhodospiraceae bacterium WFHF3C12]|nr:GNAT family N-acetyltransferase [Ectothiorhodospiraceae bacterium WFHF3C12]
MEVRPMEIRRANRDDADQVFALANELTENGEVPRERFDEAFPDLLAHDTSHCLVAAVGEQINGYACGHYHVALHTGVRVAYLEEMVVTEDLRNSGIGRQLVQAFETWALEQGCGRAALAAQLAGPFYESLGYEAAGTHYRKPL